MGITKRMHKWMVLFIVLIVVSAIFIGCGQEQETNQAEENEDAITGTVRIGIQHGLGYAALLLMDELDLLEKRLPDVDVQYVQMASATPLTELIVNDDVDIITIGPAPFLIAWDKGVPMKLIGASAGFPIELVTWREDINSLADISPEDRIAVPSVFSQQHLQMSMALEEQLSDPNKLDENVVAMGHEEAFANMRAKKDIIAHYATPPYLFEELKLGYHSITSAEEVMGQYRSPLAVSTKFYDNNKQIVSAFIEALEESQAILREEPEKAVEILAPIFKFDEEVTLEYLTWEGMEFTRELRGVLDLADFMYRNEFISKPVESYNDVAFEEAKGD